MEESRLRHHQPTESRGKQSKKGSFQTKKNHSSKSMSNDGSYHDLQFFCISISDDPYYCGLRARIPNFAKSKAQKEKETPSSRVTQNPLGPAAGVMPAPHHHPMAAWHHGARGYPDNVPHPGNMTSGYGFRNRPFERNPTTWVPTAPMRNAVSEWESYWQNEH